MDALVTYSGNKVGYSAVRSLAGLGLRVAVADVKRVGMSQWSRFCRKRYVFEHPYNEAEAFMEDMVRILGDCGAAFLLPAQSETEVLARYRDRLPPGVTLPLADYRTISAANDKAWTAAYARDMGLDVPEVIEWDTWDELEEKTRAAGFRTVVKLTRGFSSRWVFYPKDAAETVALCKGLADRHSLGPGRMPIVQRWVDGEKWGVACLYHEGKMLASFTQKMLRQKPATGGASTLRVSARNAKIEACTERLLDGMAWHGIAMLEFIYDPASGEAWFIEINPRLWASINLAVASGVDLVALLYIAATEGPDAALKMSRPQKDDVLCRWWLGDVALAVSEARRLRLVSALKLFLPGGTDVYDEFRMDDPGASAGAIASPVAGFLGKKPKREEGKDDSPYLDLDNSGDRLRQL